MYNVLFSTKKVISEVKKRISIFEQYIQFKSKNR